MSPTKYFQNLASPFIDYKGTSQLNGCILFLPLPESELRITTSSLSFPEAAGGLETATLSGSTVLLSEDGAAASLDDGELTERSVDNEAVAEAK